MGIPSLEALMQVNLRTMLKVDQPSFASVHTPCEKKMKFTKLKSKFKIPTIWSHGINNPKKHVHVFTLIIWTP